MDAINVILLGNKIDIEGERNVSYDEGYQYAKEHNFLFMETSALDNREKCIEKSFFLLIKTLNIHI